MTTSLMPSPVASIGDFQKQTMTVAIPDLVSERSERRVSGIHASLARKPEVATAIGSWHRPSIAKCVNAKAHKREGLGVGVSPHAGS